ncbi:MAG TPA: Hsp33 family molecular chaperone HslO [Methylophilaceae bacterium]|jgi:molecular chaperone Hsp33|nr:Hsp33 family molecular chaperone HslO [Methylophilaceae bacterium]
MSITDSSLSRFIFEDAPIRGEFTHVGEAWRTMLAQHDYPSTLKGLLGELVAASALLAATLKLRGSLILQIQGNGPISLLVVECTGDLKMRATAKWKGDLPHARLADLVGEGSFVITLDPKDGNQTYQGIVPLEGDSVAEALQNYMTRSEQLETRLWLAADSTCVGGMLLQKMPEREAKDEDAWNRIGQLAATLTPNELLELPAPDILHRLFHEEDIRLFEAQEVRFECTCSRDSVTGMLRMLGHDEIRSIVEEQGRVEVHCEFCNQRYEFDPVDAEQVFASTIKIPGSEAKH